MERTNFKTGFAGVKPALFDKNHVYTLPAVDKIRLALYYGKEFLLNPAYMNESLLDSSLCLFLLLSTGSGVL